MLLPGILDSEDAKVEVYDEKKVFDRFKAFYLSQFSTIMLTVHDL